MSDPDDYDLLVLGSGEAGKIRAWTLRDSIMTHPTMAEGLVALFWAGYARV